MTLNKITIIGFVGQDPQQIESRVQFSVATSEKWNDEAGNAKERTDWHNCVAFNRQAEIIMQYVKKGSLVYVEGRQRHNKVEAANGNTKYYSSISVDRVLLLDRKESSERGGGIPVVNEPLAGNRQSQNINTAGIPTNGGDDDELPF